MASRTKLARAELGVVSSLQASATRVHSRADLAALFYAERKIGTFAGHTTLGQFLTFLTERGHLIPVTLRSKRYDQSLTRYCVGTVSPFELASSLRRTGYFSHATAAYLHGLLTNKPDALHLNVEQSAKPSRAGTLTQIALNRAFQSKQRQSNLSFTHQDLTVTILSGKHTERLGVESLKGPSTELLQVTNLERTLIDLVVRPAYAGGTSSVLEAYRSARDRMSASHLIDILRSLNHLYPYAQAIGFLMQRTGYSEDHLALLRPEVTEFQFYLEHGMKKSEYDDVWRLHYPKRM